MPDTAAVSRGDQGPRLYLRVAQALLSMISEENLSHGDRLPGERELALSLGVSRPTVREALLSLELVGCVDVRVGDGVFVRSGPMPRDALVPLDADPRQLLEARLVIEPSVARYVAGCELAKDDLADLYECLARSDEYAADDAQLGQFISIGLDFHRLVARAAPNTILIDTVCRLVDVATHPLWLLANRASMGSRTVRQGNVEEHRAIVEAIAQGRQEETYALMREHVAGMMTRFFG